MAQTAVELWQLKELLFLSPGKQNSDIYLSCHSRNSCLIAQGSVSLMLKELGGEFHFFLFVPEILLVLLSIAEL